MEPEPHFTDNIGESTVAEDCAICYAVSCFSCVHGYCTALEKYTTGGCSFYKEAEENRWEIRKCFYRLISRERFDLLYKYAETMAALGLMDKELEDAEKQMRTLSQYRSDHLSSLMASNWKDSLTVVFSTDDGDEKDVPLSESGVRLESVQERVQETIPEMSSEDEFDNSIDQAVFPDGITDQALEDEMADQNEVGIGLEIQDEKYFSDSIAEEMQEFSESVQANPEDELPSDFPEDFDENGPLTYNEWLEQAEEQELMKEAAEEQRTQMAQDEQVRAEDGEEAYVTLPLNFLYRRIGFPVRQKQPPDPVDLAYSIFGANIVYQAADDYINALRMLWSGEYQNRMMHRLVIRKWELETFIGSNPYWVYTNISPARLLDQCRKTAEERARAKIERDNRRIAAGIESGDAS